MCPECGVERSYECGQEVGAALCMNTSKAHSGGQLPHGPTRSSHFASASRTMNEEARVSSSLSPHTFCMMSG
jgi:hypothetical protein